MIRSELVDKEPNPYLLCAPDRRILNMPAPTLAKKTGLSVRRIKRFLESGNDPIAAFALSKLAAIAEEQGKGTSWKLRVSVTARRNEIFCSWPTA